MENFVFQNPVKIIFGKHQIQMLSHEIPTNCNILLTYGQGSIKKNGIYDQVLTALHSHSVYEFGNIEPNPHYETLMQAVHLVREKKINFLLAVGGGSVIDGTKFIAAAAPFKGEPWDILAKQIPVDSAIPLGCVLTLPATGTEMNGNAVITKQATQDKLYFSSQYVFPKFSILDPSTTFTLSPKQTANGIADAFVHVIEQYLTYPVNSPLQDRFSESILHTLIEEAPTVLNHPHDYNARANIMWCATMALNHLIGMGVPQDWATHILGHELTACYGLDHGHTLAIVLPHLMQVCREQKREKLLQYAERVWQINEGPENHRIDQAISKTQNFFKSLGLSVSLSSCGIDEKAIPILLEQLSRHHFTALGERGQLGLSDCEKIYRACL